MSLPPLYWLLDDFDDSERLPDIRWTSRVCRDNISHFGRLVASEAIDCAWTPSRHVLAARNPLEVAALRWIMPRFEAIGQHCEFLAKEQMAQFVGYPAIAGMAYEIVSIQPYRLARGLRQRCLDQGVRIYEHTPIESIRSTSKGMRLIAADGATLSFYMGRVHGNRLIFNGVDRASRVTPEDDRHLPCFARLHKEMLRRLPFLESVPLAGAWGGAVQQTTTDAPIVRRSQSNPNVILNIGYGGGSGVGMALLSGQLTTGLVLERGPLDNDAQRLRALLANSRFPRMGPVRAALGVLRKMIPG